MGRIEKAVELLLLGHTGQKDKSGDPYILHPLRVGLSIPKEFGENYRSVGFMHDLLEDTELPQYVIEQAFPAAVLDGLFAVTRHHFGQETYREFVKRAAQSPIGRIVKYYDILDNTRPERLVTAGLRDMEKKRYAPAKAVLLEAMTEQERQVIKVHGDAD